MNLNAITLELGYRQGRMLGAAFRLKALVAYAEMSLTARELILEIANYLEADFPVKVDAAAVSELVSADYASRDPSLSTDASSDGTAGERHAGKVAAGSDR